MAQKYYCGVPDKECSGATHITNSMLNRAGCVKLHADSEDAFRCYRRWLISQGYEQVGPREFARGREPIRVLTRKSKFGTRMRAGKGKEGATGSRFMPLTTRGFVHGD